MKLIIATIAACTLLPMSALAQTNFPAPPPELSGSIDFGTSVDYGPSWDIDEAPGAPEMGFAVSDEPDVLMIAQATAPAPPPCNWVPQGIPGRVARRSWPRAARLVMGCTRCSSQAGPCIRPTVT